MHFLFLSLVYKLNFAYNLSEISFINFVDTLK